MTTEKQAPQQPATTSQDPQTPPTHKTAPPAPSATPAPAPSKGKGLLERYGDEVIRQVVLQPPKTAAPHLEIVNLQSSPVQVMYVPVGQKKSISHKIPVGGARPGEYPPELLDAPHFKDLSTPPHKVLEVREL